MSWLFDLLGKSKADMGGGNSKPIESPERYYTELAVQFKDRLDNLELVAQSLVHNTASQTSTLNFILKEEDKKAATAETHGQDATGTRPTVSQQATDPGAVKDFGEKHSSGPDLTGNKPQPQGSSKIPNKGGSGQGTRPKSAKKKGDKDLEHQKSSDSIDTEPRSGKRAVRSFVATDPTQDDSGQAMDVEFEDQGCDSVDDGKQTPSTVPLHSEPTHQRINRNLLETLKQNQASTVAISSSILQSVHGLQSLIPREISEQHQSRAPPRPENASYQIKLYENTTYKPVTSVTCRESETQTLLNAEGIENMIKNFNLAKKEIGNLGNLKKSHEREIGRLKQDLEFARGNGQTNVSAYGQSRWGKPWGSAPPPRKKASVQIYCHRRSDKINAVNYELETLLKTQFATDNTDLMCTSCEEKGQLDKNIPIIVLCIKASRLGTDVASSLEGLSWTNKIVVVVLHHKDTHALPRQPSSRLLISSEYKSLGGLIDMAFLSNKGIYTCDMNNQALSALMSFINGGRID